MMDQAGSRALSLDCHGERGDGQFGTHVLAHRPTHHLAGEQVEDHGQVEPALAGRDIGNIGQPDFIGPVGDKILLEQVFCHGEGMLAVGCAHAIAARGPRARMPCWRIIRSTRLRLTVWPSAHSSAWMRGAPYRSWCCAWTRRMSTSSARLAILRGLPGRERHT